LERGDITDTAVLPGHLTRYRDFPAGVGNGLGKKVILRQVTTKFLYASSVIQQLFPHESRHAGGTVDSHTVSGEVYAGVRGAEIDLLEYGGEAGSVTHERHLVYKAGFVIHVAKHKKKNILTPISTNCFLKI
jgi:hypothetical protein